MDINLFHDLHGHDGLPRMRAKANVLGIHLTGKLQCDACSTVKAKSAAIQRKMNHPANAPNEQIFGQDWSLQSSCWTKRLFIESFPFWFK